MVRHFVGKSCPALSSELGLMLLASQVVRGSVARSCFRYCSLITHHCSLFKFQLSAASGRAGSFRKKLYLISGRIAYAEPDSSTT